MNILKKTILENIYRFKLTTLKLHSMLYKMKCKDYEKWHFLYFNYCTEIQFSEDLNKEITLLMVSGYIEYGDNHILQLTDSGIVYLKSLEKDLKIACDVEFTLSVGDNNVYLIVFSDGSSKYSAFFNISKLENNCVSGYILVRSSLDYQSIKVHLNNEMIHLLNSSDLTSNVIEKLGMYIHNNLKNDFRFYF